MLTFIPIYRKKPHRLINKHRHRVIRKTFELFTNHGFVNIYNIDETPDYHVDENRQLKKRARSCSIEQHAKN